MPHRSDPDEFEAEAGELTDLFRLARERTALVARTDALAGPLSGAPSGARTWAMGPGLEPVAWRRPAASAAVWLRAAGVLVALALGAAGILLMGGGDRYLLAEVRRAEGALLLERTGSLERTGVASCGETVSAGASLRSGDVLRCRENECTVELSTGCLLVLSGGGSVRLDRAPDGSLRLTVGKGALDFSTSLPRAYLCSEDTVLRCDGPAALRVLGGGVLGGRVLGGPVLGGPDVEVRSGCVMLREPGGSGAWSVVPCDPNASCSTRPR